jgi:hypothetical protein
MMNKPRVGFFTNYAHFAQTVLRCYPREIKNPFKERLQNLKSRTEDGVNQIFMKTKILTIWFSSIGFILEGSHC